MAASAALEASAGGLTGAECQPGADGQGSAAASSGGNGRGWLWCWGAALLSGLLHAVAFPPFDAAAAAYVFALPLLLLLAVRRQPGRQLRGRTFGLSVFGGFWLSWVIILQWLRFVEPPWGALGGVLLAAVLAVFPLLWFVAARAVVPVLPRYGLLRRILLLFALAGWWVVLEWVRSWLFTGFPWLPLAASQWQLPVMLQPAAWAGQYGVSFMLVYVNLALLQYLRNWLVRFEPEEDSDAAADAADTGGAGASAAAATAAGTESAENAANAEATEDASAAPRGQRRQFGLGGDAFSARPSMGSGFGGGLGGPAGRVRVRLCPEFYLALIMVMGAILLYQHSLTQMRERLPMFAAAVVQPWIPASMKWEPEQAKKTLDVLFDLTLAVPQLEPRPDVVIWPETATPYSMLSDESGWMRRWSELLVSRINTPLLTGALARMDGQLFNGLFYVSPQAGLSEIFYSKRRLVPFGEYRPLRTLLPFIDKVVPLETDISAGLEPTLITALIAGQQWRIGTMICYEDIFGQLGRSSVQAGADLLLVITNDAWYGESSGAYQHAAHSVLRAVEMRRPLLRCGNHGWSGWIDEAGMVRGNLTDGTDNVYLRGSASFSLVQSVAWVGRQSFYVRHGDWFVTLCAVLSLWGLASIGLPALIARRRTRSRQSS